MTINELHKLSKNEMENLFKQSIEDFKTIANEFAVKSIKDKMLAVCKEKPEYMADELLLLSEEILSQVAAYGVCLYLQHGGNLQTEKNNDYILHDLFLHEGHQNAGPVFDKICGAVNDIKENLTALDSAIELFNNELNKESGIYKDLKKLAAFRNALMHGFFKLPATENIKTITEIHEVLKKLRDEYKIFEHKADFHFWKNEGFCGHWKIQDNDNIAWDKLSGEVTPFEKLARRANEELHSADKEVSGIHAPTSELEKQGDLEGFIAQANTNDSVNNKENNKAKKKPAPFKESLYVQFHPRDKKKQDEFYEIAKALINQKENVELLSYTIDENGIGYTSYLLMHRLLKKLALQTNEKEPKKKIKSKVAEIKNKGKKLVILINNIHLVPFASDHITSLMKFFKDSGIYFIGIGWEYEHLNSVFSQKLDLREERNERNAIPDDKELKQLIKNHTRHRGPFENEDEYKILLLLIEHILEQLENKQEIKARELADKIINDQRPGIELVNEALYILYPFFKYDQSGNDNNFMKDDLDELYGFPKNQTETSSIFLTLGRRDIDLEYKHKILKP